MMKMKKSGGLKQWKISTIIKFICVLLGLISVIHKAATTKTTTTKTSTKVKTSTKTRSIHDKHRNADINTDDNHEEEGVIKSRKKKKSKPEKLHDQISNNNNNNVNNNNENDRLLEWVLKEGGYWNPKQRLGYDETGTLFGVFALSAIRNEELLARIPWSAVIQANATAIVTATVGTRQSLDRFDPDCQLARALQTEIEKGQSSHYHLYTSVLQQTVKDHYSLLPTNWSPQGQALLRAVLNSTATALSSSSSSSSFPPHIPPHDMFLQNFHWKHHCEQTVGRDATLLVMTHGEDFGMVPLTDRYNCRTGEDYTGAYFTASATTDAAIALEIRAYRDLKPQEQIYTDYHDYGQIGTPELLRDYGFVESYPQRYIFHAQKIAFQVDLQQQQQQQQQSDSNNHNSLNNKNNNGSSNTAAALKVTWMYQNDRVLYLHPDYLGGPDSRNRMNFQKATLFLQKQHKRLQQHVCPDLYKKKKKKKEKKEREENDSNNHSQENNGVDDDDGDDVSGIFPSQYEIDTTIRFCHDMMVAIEAALFDIDI